MRAWLNLRYVETPRWSAFEAGLRACGYEVRNGTTNKPLPGDVLVTWNRIGTGQKCANEFEAAGAPVLVAENATWGNGFNNQRWYHIARTRHNTAGMFPIGGPERWDDLGVELAPFRGSGFDLVLPQRGIGSRPTAMPAGWGEGIRRKHNARIRHHPGTNKKAPSLESDLQGCGRVLTWGSGAAIKALMMGCQVKSYMPDWIGAQDNTPEGRLAMFRQLAWAQWTLDEISSGAPFARLLGD